MSKRVSLILTTYNSADNLVKTLDSIDNQDYDNIEVIIKDGGSTDDTLNIIKAYADKHNGSTEAICVNYVSKIDTGIYDAMNQGYGLSTGEIVAFFNDRFVVNDAISKMVRVIEINGDDVIGAHADLVYANDEKIVRTWKMGEQKSLLTGWMPGHPTLFLKKEVYKKYGLYDTSYKIAADYEFMVRFLKDKKNKLAYVPENIISMFYGGTSNSTLGSYIESLKEGHRALVTNNVHPAFIADGFRTLRVLLQFIKHY